MEYSSALVWGGEAAASEGFRSERTPSYGVSQASLRQRMATDLGEVIQLLDDVLNVWGQQAHVPGDSTQQLRIYAQRVSDLNDDMMLLENTELRQALNCYYRELAAGVAMLTYQHARTVRLQKQCAVSPEAALCRELDARLRECVRQLRWLRSEARSLTEQCRRA